MFCWFVTYCHLPKISLWRLRRFTKSQSHLNSTNPVTALCTWRIQNHQATCHRVVLSLTLHRIPCRPHRPFPGPLASVVHSIHGGARGQELLHDGLAELSRLVQRCFASGAEGLGDVNGWRAPPRGSPPPNPHCSGRNCNLWSEVREFHLFQHCIVSWFNGSHYRCWCL